MPDLGNPSSKRARAFTFPEVIALVGVMALMAGLATQLLLSGHVFTARIDTQQKQLQAALRLRLEFGRWAQTVTPAPWADPARAFVQEGSTLTVYETPGVTDARQWTLKTDGHKLDVQAGKDTAEWGPFDTVSLAWWTKDNRVLGVAVTWSAGTEQHQWLFPWGSRPL